MERFFQKCRTYRFSFKGSFYDSRQKIQMVLPENNQQFKTIPMRQWFAFPIVLLRIEFIACIWSSLILFIWIDKQKDDRQIRHAVAHTNRPLMASKFEQTKNLLVGAGRYFYLNTNWAFPVWFVTVRCLCADAILVEWPSAVRAHQIDVFFTTFPAILVVLSNET